MKEEVARLCHEQWSEWMAYLFSKGEFQEDGTWVMPDWAVTRWQRQREAAYEDLSEDEKDSDRAEADKFLALFEEASDGDDEFILYSSEQLREQEYKRFSEAQVAQ